MKIVLLLARGIEGCGVTKFSIEQAKWFKKNKYQYSIIAGADKYWLRNKSHYVDEIQKLYFSRPEHLKQIITQCNNADIVIVNSLPSISHPPEAILGYSQFLKELKTPMVLIQHDHSSLSIKRNACINESINKAALIFGHSSSNDFAEYVSDVTGGGGLSDFFSDDTSKSITTFQPGFDFDADRKKYWKDIEEQDIRLNRWIGRTTSWKGYNQMFDFHNNFLRPSGFITILEGIERSPAYTILKTLSKMHDYTTPANTKSMINMKFEINQPAYVFGYYKNEEMLHRLSRSAFGYQLSMLKPKYIERSIEYTHCEVVSSGTIPVFRKTYGELCKHRDIGNPLIECKDSGTVWFDDNNMQSTLDTIKMLSNDNIMRDEWRNMAFEFYKSHQDSEFVFAEMMEKIKNICINI
jgi:hypothetical protein